MMMMVPVLWCLIGVVVPHVGVMMPLLWGSLSMMMPLLWSNIGVVVPHVGMMVPLLWCLIGVVVPHVGVMVPHGVSLGSGEGSEKSCLNERFHC